MAADPMTADPITEIIHCHTCTATKLRIVRNPTSGQVTSLPTDLQKWRWIILRSHCYCETCAPQALANAIDELWNYLNGDLWDHLHSLLKPDNP
jgi:hypothetical protein